MREVDTLPSIIINKIINQIKKDGEFREKLLTLKPYVKDLRTAFIDKYPCTVNYDDFNYRLAYLLAYYPHYAGLTNFVIQKAVNRSRKLSLIMQKKILRICIIGGGPLPEMIGISHFLNINKYDTNILAIDVIDKYSNGWNRVQWLGKKELESYYPKPDIILRSHIYEFENIHNKTPEEILKSIQNADIIFMQNCVNEFQQDANSTSCGIVFCLENMKVNSAFFLINMHLAIYIKGVEKFLKENGSTFTYLFDYDCNKSEDYKAFKDVPNGLAPLFTGKGNLIFKNNVYHQKQVILKIDEFI